MKKNKIIYLNGLIDLAQSRLGSKIVYKTDEFFAPANRIINPWPPVFKEGVFDKNGKWMDGWETRRKRSTGHDYLVLKFGKPGTISKIDVDTSYFNGNQPSKISIDACYTKKNIPDRNDWMSILGKKTTKPNSHHFFKINKRLVFTHIRLNIFPDGGVARLRVYGTMRLQEKLKKSKINLMSLLNGAVPIACNNEHFGRAENVLAPGKGINMGDGWETRRSRGKNFDWLILKCASPGIIEKLQIDTHHFKGNYPDKCSVQASYIKIKSSQKNIVKKSNSWKFLLKNTKLKAHKEHNFKITKNNRRVVNYIRINIFPDGGISRLRAFGVAKP